MAPDPRNAPVGTITITFSEPVTGFDLADLALTRDGGANLLTAAQTLTTADNVTWTLGNLAGLTGTAGRYVLTLTAAGSGITDAAGNPLAADASDAFVVDATPPTADILDVTPDPRNTAVGHHHDRFSEPVTGFDLADLALTRDGGANLLTAAQTLTTADNVTWTLGDLAGLTSARARYILTPDGGRLGDHRRGRQPPGRQRQRRLRRRRHAADGRHRWTWRPTRATSPSARSPSSSASRSPASTWPTWP